MSDDILNVDEDIKPEEDSFQNQFLPLEPSSSRSSLNRISEEFNFALPSSSVKANMVVEEARYTYPTQLTNSFDRENWTVSTDHCYARPWNWRPEAGFLRPTKTLFIPKLVPVKSNSCSSIPEPEEIVDIEAEVEVPAPTYDVEKAKSLMEECERHAFAVRTDTEEDWEEKVSRLNWTSGQHKLFNAMVNILNSLNLAKLAYSGCQNEPLLRRTIIDKAVQRVRRLLASVLWDPKLVQWIHQIMLDNLSPHYLACYLDILQTLKAKVPHFLDKMMHGSTSSVRMGTINNASLTALLEKPWDPLSATLMQDKPKKLPGNPVVILMPSGPVISKMIHKWIKLLSTLASVVTIPTNFDFTGSTGHRITIPCMLDQLFSATRAKIQDIKDDYPGRNLILMGFNSGAALALQIAQVESVLCVISIGFSLMTAQGPRGEPDDTILELQCPVLFIIGQCSSTSSQEDLEDLRERMRVETSLLVVGSADDYLRVNKKKKRQEGITQSIVDRCIVDEIGEFVSSLILSPYPPQIRQSPAHVPPETPVKKGNPERKRYNSNTSSLDSEPPSPTPVRITRPVGRPPGSKSKNRLEAKWAQQIAQGNTPANPSLSSPTSPPSYPTAPTPDTSSNDSFQTEKPTPQSQHSTPPKQSDQPLTLVKKIKTLKPVVNTETKTTSSPVKNQPQQTARMQAFGINRNLGQGNTSVTNLLQGGIKTIPPSIPKASSSGIKVLENVTLNSTTGGKLLPNRTIDLSKITLLNSVKTPSTPVSNVLLLPDGKIKTIGSAVKTANSTPLLVPVSPPKSLAKPTVTTGPKYITAKRQLMNQKPPRPMKKPVYMPASNVESSLPPPTNLTTQDIMDLPIIFADDNQIISTSNASNSNVGSSNTTSTTVASSTPSVQLVTQQQVSKAPAKFMLVNKHSLGPGNFILTNSSVKKATPVTFSKPTPKYTKIILSSKKTGLEEVKNTSKIQCLSPEITVKKVLNAQQAQLVKPQSILAQQAPVVPGVELVDLENEIKATAVPKPNMSTSDIKNIKIFPKSSMEGMSLLPIKSEKLTQKRLSTSLEVDEGDPDYIPPKSLKLE